ncbi:MAG TPA: RNA polymerase sigma factor [Crocinitomix sp.]|nr:RNA polymerase sigma factor [Crocinitomix sp.]
MTVKEYNTAVDDFADNIYRFVLKHLKNVDATKDVVQDTFAKVWVKHKNISAQKVKSYLFTTAYNTLIDVLRKEKYNEDIEQLDKHFNQRATKNIDLQEILHSALNQLPEIQKTVILLRDYEGYDYAEIGKITHLKESQVKVYIFRARKKLKQILVSVEAVLEV